MDSLIEQIKSLPDSPGVYQYFDELGRLLYVGKAKSLKNRVKSYFRFTPSFAPAPNLSPRIYKMVHETKKIEYIVVNSENDALILENSLIKQLKPKYNILLRDDKTFPYIYIDFDEPFARPKITRKVIKGKKVRYFGPFSTAAKDILDSIYELFPLVQKDGCLSQKKACLFYQLKRCPAPCEGKITQKEYLKILNDSIEYIVDKNRIIQKLSERMESLSEELRFEEAAQIRDRIKRIQQSQIHSDMDLAKLEDIDIIAVYAEKSRAALVRMFMRNGKVISSSSKIFRFDEERGFDIEEAYKRAVLEFYGQDSPLTAKKIYTAHPFEESQEVVSVLKERFKKPLSIRSPKRGEGKRVTELALLNAKEILRKEGKSQQLPKRLKELLKLESTPYRIEIFDNSHLRGKAPVGAMVVWENGRFLKSDYRHFNLASKDEYSQMRELLSRRCESFIKSPPPDLWVIDGGEALRVLAEDILSKYGVVLEVIAISKEKKSNKTYRSKGKASDTIHTKFGPLSLSPFDERLNLLQKLRDEAHRFALEFHKKQRLKIEKEISLLKAKGIGEAKLKRALDYFGSFENIKNASLEELCEILGPKTAKSLKSTIS